MILFYFFTWCTGLIYLAFLVIMFSGLKKMPRSLISEDDEALPTVTIVVAARDEETRIGRLLDSLEAQDYPRSKFNVIVVDDRSRDNTTDLVKKRKNGGVRFATLKIRDGETPVGRAPKKYALARGIEKADGEIIVTTDADCWMSSRWLRALVSPFIDPDIHGATGVSRFIRPENDPKPWWSDYESLEHLFYSVAAAGAIGAGHVFNAHGSNLAARRSVYDRVGGYSSNKKVVSGDDVFLLQDIAEHGGKVVFIDRREGYVYSQPVDTIQEWVNQRARWSSKGFYYPPFLRYLVVGTFAFYTAMVLSIPLAIMRRFSPALPVFLIASKLMTESMLMRLGSHRFGEDFSLIKFLITQTLHSPAILYAGMRGQFFSFTWKGDRYRGAGTYLGNENSGDDK
ncbi:MAG: glycosyltransferase [Candidatus Electryonea clarkiae]|nr:glycosyltransferase [Candidatus Electryonea clarkiae]